MNKSILLLLLLLIILPSCEREERKDFVVTRRSVPMDSKIAGDSIREIEERFSNVFIPKTVFDETPIREAVSWVQQQAVDLDRHPGVSRRGISVILSFPTDSNDSDPFRSASDKDDGFSFGGGVAISDSNTPITLHLSQSSVLDVLNEIASLANLRLQVESHAIVMVPLDEPDPTKFAYDYQLTPDMVDRIAIQPITELVDPFSDEYEYRHRKEKSKVPVVDVVDQSGISLNEVKYDQKTRRLSIVGMAASVQSFEEIMWVWSDRNLKLVDADSNQAIEISESMYSKRYNLQPDHWLWLYRIAKDDMNSAPKGYDVENPNFKLINGSASETYRKCGIELAKGETVIYSVEASVMIAKLTLSNHDYLQQLHARIFDLRGR